MFPTFPIFSEFAVICSFDRTPLFPIRVLIPVRRRYMRHAVVTASRSILFHGEQGESSRCDLPRTADRNLMLIVQRDLKITYRENVRMLLTAGDNFLHHRHKKIIVLCRSRRMNFEKSSVDANSPRLKLAMIYHVAMLNNLQSVMQILRAILRKCKFCRAQRSGPKSNRQGIVPPTIV